MTSDIWPLTHAERRALLADVKAIPDAQAWTTPSLCPGWSVQDVLAHMTATASTTPVGFVTGLAKARFSFDRFVNSAIVVHKGSDPEATVKNFEATLTSTDAPPGPKASWLGEAVVHAEDIRRPLGISHDYDPAALRTLADFYKGSNALIGAKRRIAGVQLRATDDSWTHGTGDLVEGPLLSLLMTMTGRKVYLDDLSGPGVPTLRARN